VSSKISNSLTHVQKRVRKLGHPERAAVSLRYFKTGAGQYGQGDIFVGLSVPQIRELAREFSGLRLAEIQTLLKSPVHEERLLALLLLIRAYRQGSAEDRNKIFHLYLKNTKYINNWDLVDASAERILGPHLDGQPKLILYDLAGSGNLWERRIAIMASFHFIKQGEFCDTLRLVRMLLGDNEDLIHKAAGWMLREVGKRNLQAEEKFLKKYYQAMPRTMLRYAIERFPAERRKEYLTGKV
jgi:3-methyladenine DNA glycosylase AlkD